MLVTRITRTSSRRVITLREELTFMLGIDALPEGRLIYTVHQSDSIHMPGVNVLEYTSLCCGAALSLTSLSEAQPQNTDLHSYIWKCNWCKEPHGELLYLSEADYDRELASTQLALVKGAEINVAEITEFLIPWISDKQYFDEFTVIIEAHELAREIKAIVESLAIEKES